MNVTLISDENFTADNNDLNISPVTLSHTWPRVARLLILTSFAVIGSVGNVFMISAVMVEDHLKKRGNAYLVNVALADLLVSGLVIPASAVVLLAGEEYEKIFGVCRFEWTLEVLCFLVTVLTFAAIAIENYMRLCLPVERYAILSNNFITWSILAIWLIAGIAVAIQSGIEVTPDFCRRRFISKPRVEEAVGASLLVILPLLLAFLLFGRLMLSVNRALASSNKPPSLSFTWDYELAKANICSCLLFILFWSPLGISICTSSVRTVNASAFIYLAWFALSKSCINFLLYCCLDRHFRSAYNKLFHYCCCKTTVSFSVAGRQARQRQQDLSRTSDHKLRVHIIHSYASPAASRPYHHHQGSSRPNGRDVYEL